MAQKVQIILIDDIDGGQADETVLFALDGTSYEIDLSARNASRLRSSSGRSGARRPASTRSGKSAEIRAWAREQGLAVNERGRIPADLTAKFEAAH
jgi:hypothetical protein